MYEFLLPPSIKDLINAFHFLIYLSVIKDSIKIKLNALLYRSLCFWDTALSHLWILLRFKKKKKKKKNHVYFSYIKKFQFRMEDKELTL